MSVALVQTHSLGVALSTQVRVCPTCGQNLPPEHPSFTPERIFAIRKKLGEPRRVFCQRLSVSLRTVWAWEHGKQRPHRIFLPALLAAEREAFGDSSSQNGRKARRE